MVTKNNETRMEAKAQRLEAKNKSEFLLISYPKCGRTWLRLMLGRIFQTHFGLTDANLLELDELGQLNPNIPKIWVSHDDKPQWKKPEELVTSKEEYKDKKVIFLVRDPRDVVVSNYFQKTKRREAYNGSLSEYIYEPLGSFETILKFYNIWAENRTVPQKFLLVRYEDIHNHSQSELGRILEFLGLSGVTEQIIRETIEYASFENMRKMEVENTFDSPRLNPLNPTDPTSYKTREGKVGGFVDHLSREEIEYLNRRMKESLSDFYGYSIDIMDSV